MQISKEVFIALGDLLQEFGDNDLPHKDPEDGSAEALVEAWSKVTDWFDAHQDAMGTDYVLNMTERMARENYRRHLEGWRRMLTHMPGYTDDISRVAGVIQMHAEFAMNEETIDYEIPTFWLCDFISMVFMTQLPEPRVANAFEWLVNNGYIDLGASSPSDGIFCEIITRVREQKRLRELRIPASAGEACGA
jgi:hypothetical protein